MKRAALIFTLLLTAACGRPLSDGEERFARAFHGEGLDTSKVRVVRNPVIKLFKFTVPYPPRTTCAENILPPPETEFYTGAPAATVLFNHITVNPDALARDYMAAYPEAANLLATMFLAHELVHTWQWQNRAKTGYHPWKAAAEHQASPDPYLFDLDTTPGFLGFGYEQQGAIAAEYVCCAALAPGAARTKRLDKMLSKHFPLTDLTYNLAQTPVVLPWKDAELNGICD